MQSHLLLLEADPVALLIGGAIAFFVGIFITRLIFSVDTFLDNTKMQTRLLELIAKKGGATEEELMIARRGKAPKGLKK